MPQALIYGWALQFGFAFVQYAFRRLLAPDQPAALGGSWLSLIAGHLGGVFLWASIVAVDAGLALHGLAYVTWFVALLPIATQLWRVVSNQTSAEPRSSDTTVIGAGILAGGD